MPYQSSHNLCTLCQLLPLSSSISLKHEFMAVAGPCLQGSGEAQRSLYQCSNCKTLWLYERDHWGACLGFKLWQGTQQDFQR